MQHRDQKRNAPAGSRGGSENDSFDEHIDDQNYKTDSPFRQGNYSYISLPNLTAVARKFGFLGALYFIYSDGSEQFLGLFGNKHDAAFAARVVNKLLAMGARHG